MAKAFIPLPTREKQSSSDMVELSASFCKEISSRRTVRDFSSQGIDDQVIKNCILAAGSAPSGANQQPWHFAIISSQEIKQKIREAAEAEEREFYAGRAGDVWLDTLAPLGTDADKPFLEEAPILIAIFEKKYEIMASGEKKKNYYAKESTGIATGVLITALHQSGLATLTHTPSPMNFLTRLLKRPEGERPFLLLVVGHPKEDAMVPNITKKTFEEISSTH